MSFGVTFRSELQGVSGWVVEELDHLSASLEGYLFAEHHNDGTHSDITADSLTVSGDSTLLGALQIGPITLGPTHSDDPSPNILIDATNGLAVRYGTTNKMTLDMSGAATFTGTVNATAGYFGDGSTRVSIEAAGINVGNTGSIRGGQSAHDTGTGFWLGYTGGAYKLSLGNASGNKLLWDGTNLDVVARVLNLGVGTVWGSSGGVYFVSSTVTGSNFGVQGSELGGGLVGRSLNIANIATSDDDVDITLTADNSTASPATITLQSWDSDDELTSAISLNAPRVIITGNSALQFYTASNTLKGSFLTATTQGLQLETVNPLRLPSVDSSTGTALIIDASGWVYKLSSSARYKEHVAPWAVSAEALARFVALSPQMWDYKGKPTGAAGFIAEDLAALPIRNAYGRSPLVNYDASGLPESNRDYALVGLQHLVVQDHEARIAALEARLS